MMIALVFLLGVANFTLHKAVLESGHPLLGRLPWYVHMLGGRLTLLTEFLVLLAAMLLTSTGWAAAAWIYLGYTALNGVSAWLIFSGKV